MSTHVLLFLFFLSKTHTHVLRFRSSIDAVVVVNVVVNKSRKHFRSSVTIVKFVVYVCAANNNKK